MLRQAQERGSWRSYAQSQGIHELKAQDGQVAFAPVSVARQVAAGVEHRFGDGWAARIEAYSRTSRDPLPE